MYPQRFYPIQSVKMPCSLSHPRRRHRRVLGLLSGLLVATSCGGAAPEPAALWEVASEWELDQMQARVDDWVFSAQAAQSLPVGTLAATDSLSQRYRLLVVAEDRCIDSAHSVPYFDALARASSRIEMRVINSQVGAGLLDRYRTPDGRGATPTVLVLDDGGRVRGCWLERPAGLQSWWIRNPDDMAPTDQYVAKTAWYRTDRGSHAVSEVLQVLLAADRGEFICGLPLPPTSELPRAGMP